MNTNMKRNNTKKNLVFTSLILVFFSLAFLADAEDYTSPSFIIRAPVVSSGGSRATSTSFELFGSAGQTITGISSGLNFNQSAGFLYFLVSAPETPPTQPPTQQVVTGGGGGGGPITITGINISGRAYPLSRVTILKDGQISITTIAGPDSNFGVSLTGLSGGDYNFAVYGEDSSGRRSSLFTFPVLITSGAMADIGGIFIAPTISVDKMEVKKGDDIAIFGQTAANSNVTVQVNSEEPFFAKTDSDKDGIYLYNFDTSVLAFGQHLAKSKSSFQNSVSPYGQAIGFQVGTKNVALAAPAKCNIRADLNGDCRVNLIDFSILAYWYQRPLPENLKGKLDLFTDGKIDIKDFSIMAYYWTG